MTITAEQTVTAAAKPSSHREARRRAIVLTLVKVLLAVVVGLVAVAALQHFAPALAQHYGQSTLPSVTHQAS